MASNWMAHSHELNNTDIILPLATSQATKICEQDINFHLYPTSTVITVSKSQSRTVRNVLSTLNQCDRNTSTSCELHVTNTFRPNGGVECRSWPLLATCHVTFFNYLRQKNES